MVKGKTWQSIGSLIVSFGMSLLVTGVLSITLNICFTFSENGMFDVNIPLFFLNALDCSFPYLHVRSFLTRLFMELAFEIVVFRTVRSN